MFEVIKKLIGADEEGKKRRQQALEEERREREERARENAKVMKQNADLAKGEQAK